jgi:hypothetical protein
VFAKTSGKAPDDPVNFFFGLSTVSPGYSACMMPILVSVPLPH